MTLKNSRGYTAEDLYKELKEKHQEGKEAMHTEGEEHKDSIGDEPMQVDDGTPGKVDIITSLLSFFLSLSLSQYID